MNRSSAVAVAGDETARYKGVRRRSWGKWVSEIRVPGTGERLWLGSYAAPEAAAAAHDAAVFFLRGADWSRGLNFPDRVARFAWASLSPRSVQKVASEWGMAVDAELVEARQRPATEAPPPPPPSEAEVAVWGDISVDDMEICM